MIRAFITNNNLLFKNEIPNKHNFCVGFITNFSVHETEFIRKLDTKETAPIVNRSCNSRACFPGGKTNRNDVWLGEL